MPSRTFSRWAVQMKVWLFSSMMLRALARVRVDLDQPEPLVAAVDLLIGEVMRRPCPSGAEASQNRPLDGGLGLLAAGDVEQVELVRGEFVARQRVWSLLQAWPGRRPAATTGSSRLPCRRRARLARRPASSNRGPTTAGRTRVPPCRRRSGESLRFCPCAAIGDVMILDRGLPLAVRRSNPRRARSAGSSSSRRAGAGPRPCVPADRSRRRPFRPACRRRSPSCIHTCRGCTSRNACRRRNESTCASASNSMLVKWKLVGRVNLAAGRL